MSNNRNYHEKEVNYNIKVECRKLVTRIIIIPEANLQWNDGGRI
jgi:hypothetical protein